jgi:hypothetical protein
MKLTLKKMAVAESQQMGALLIGVEKVTYLTNRCKVYETIYLHDKQSGQAGMYQGAQFDSLSAGGTIRLWRLGRILRASAAVS